MRNIVRVIVLYLITGTFLFDSARAETIAVIGTGMMGTSFGTRFAENGYNVVYGTRFPNTDRVQDLLKRTGPKARAMSQKDAAEAGSIVVMAAGNDDQAKAWVMDRVRDFGFEPMDVGPIRVSRILEGMAALYRIPHFAERREDTFEYHMRRVAEPDLAETQRVRGQ